MLSFHENGPRPGGKAYVSPEGIIHCTDGKFRWVYAFDQRKKPTVLLSMLWKYMILCAIAGAVLLAFRISSEGMASLPGGLLVLAALVLLGGLVALAFFGAHLLQNGPFVCLLFTMDGEMISCQQVKGKNTQEKVAHAIAAWVGGQSQPALRFYDPCTNYFDCVRSIQTDAGRSRILLQGTDGRNAIFADEAQLPLVLEYLQANCPNVK